MIPRLVDVIDGYVYLARRRGYTTGPTAGELREALDEAARLAAEDPSAEPAALFYALARQPLALAEGARTFPRILARNQARLMDLAIEATDGELEELTLGVCLDGLRFEEVLAWFRDRLR